MKKSKSFLRGLMGLGLGIMGTILFMVSVSVLLGSFALSSLIPWLLSSDFFSFGGALATLLFFCSIAMIGSGVWLVDKYGGFIMRWIFGVLGLSLVLLGVILAIITGWSVAGALFGLIFIGAGFALFDHGFNTKMLAGAGQMTRRIE